MPRQTDGMACALIRYSPAAMTTSNRYSGASGVTSRAHIIVSCDPDHRQSATSC